MNFTIHEDIEAPIEDVHKVISDYDSIERTALRRGIEAARLDPDAPVGVGTEWDIKFGFRGKPRGASMKIVALDAPNSMSFESETEGLNVPLSIELVALSRTHTRMTTKVDLLPTNLTAKLLVQSIRLAKGTMEKKLQARMSQIGRGIEERIAEM